MRRFAPAALLVVAASAACSPSPKPPYPFAFDLEAHAPRVLTTSEEVTVPLAVVNRGQRAWDPATIHVSYHWLWTIPRELLRRSRRVPYHDGIRTEIGERAVTPGAAVPVQGRLLAPDVPGLYWLQWDMVEEGVTWFAQVSPRQPRTLVLVVPPLAWLFAPLPLLVVLAASFGPSRLFVAFADVLWCTATLAVKPFIVAHEALLEPTPVAYWINISIAILVPVLALAVLSRRARPFVLLGVGIFASLVLLADVVYYRFFGDVWSTPALLAARQTGHVWGSVGSLFTAGLLLLVIDLPFAFVVAVRAALAPWRLSRRGRVLAAVLAIVAVLTSGGDLSARQVLADAPLDQMFRARSIVEQLGPFGFHAYDTFTFVRSTLMRPPATAEQVEDAAAWFRGRAPLRAGGPSFGLARGRNLIAVQVESLQDFVVDFRVGGQDVMPHLRRWTDGALRFTSVTDETSEGRTSDAEFATLTSLLPLPHGAVAFRFPSNHYVTLPRVLADHGYSTLSAVPFEPGFWNRQVMHPAYGFQHTLFEPDFHMTEQIGWGLNDRDFLQQMVPRLEQLPRPFAAWMITLSLHHPFTSFPESHETLKLGALEHTSFGNYLHAMRFFDQALEQFRAALARDGLLDDSVLMVFGDHDAGFTRDPAIARAIGIGADDVAWTLNDRIPLFIRVPPVDSGAEAPPVNRSVEGVEAAAGRSPSGIRTMAAGQTDIAPTLLSLFGIDASPLPLVGRNLLGVPGDGPVPRPYGDWLDARHLLVARGAAAVCYDLAARAVAPADACRASDAQARRAREISRLVILEDLQERLRGH
ncbi:MAG TPA: LTA synthase family protein [Vicinamibacterales bacterium]|nr:LTA synthase family protein [Vicinamibacterales bacterium]